MWCGVVCSIALFSGLVVGSDDPTQWMVPLGGRCIHGCVGTGVCGAGQYHLNLYFNIRQRPGTASFAGTAQTCVVADHRDYYYSNGFNVLALACVVIGQITYFMVYNPFTDQSSALFRYCPASVAAFVLPAITYYIGMKFWVYQQLKTAATTSKADSYKILEHNI